MLLLHNGQYLSRLLLLGGATAALEDFEVDEVERHQSQGEAGHDPGEEDEQARDAGVEIPRPRPERDVVQSHHQVPGAVPRHHFRRRIRRRD